MPTLTRLSSCCSDRPRDASHYKQLLSVWSSLGDRWPASPADAGSGSLLYAVALAFFYKGQTDYPDTEDAPVLLAALQRCAEVDPGDEVRVAQAVEQLSNLPGVRLARASVLLHCLHPTEFPIVDRNAAHALEGWARSGAGWPEPVQRPQCSAYRMTVAAAGYLEYRRLLLALADLSGLSLRQVEFGLYNANRKGEPVSGL